MGNLTFILELFGTVAFAISGAITGIRKNMDILGVCVLGVVTAIGGGIVRDLLLGQIPFVEDVEEALKELEKEQGIKEA